MTNLEDFILESNNIEREETHWDKEVPVYEKFLANDLTEKNMLLFHREIATSRDQLEKKYRGRYRDIPVWIGGKEATRPLLVDGMMHNLFINLPTLDAYNFHQQFERIHPFVDLNGRTGRAIWLHMMGEVPQIGFLHTWYYQSLS